MKSIILTSERKKQHLEYACEDQNLNKREHTEQLDIKHNWSITKFSFTYFSREMLLKIKNIMFN